MLENPLPHNDDEFELLLQQLMAIQSQQAGQENAPLFTPEAIESMYGMAHQMYSSGNFEQASHVFRVLTFLDATKKRNWMGLGASLQMLKQYGEAVDMYGIAGLMEENDPYIHFHAAECLFLMGEKEKGRIALNSAEMMAEKQKNKDHALISQLELFRQAWCNGESVKKDQSR